MTIDGIIFDGNNHQSHQYPGCTCDKIFLLKCSSGSFIECFGGRCDILFMSEWLNKPNAEECKYPLNIIYAYAFARTETQKLE